MRFLFTPVFLLVGLLEFTGCADATLEKDVVYDDRFERTQLDVYQPARPIAGAGGSPAVVLIHGGGWRWLSKDVVRDAAFRFAHAGYVTFGVGYRVTPEGKYPAAIQDCFCALGFLQANAETFGIDPRKITVSGYSAGGHLAAMLGVADPSGEIAPDCDTPPQFPPLAVISGDGPMDLRDLPDVFPLTNFLGGNRDEVPERYEVASPVVHVTASAPPFLLIHGTDDLIVPIGQSEGMRSRLLDVGATVRFLKLRGGHHIFNPDGSLLDTFAAESVTDGPEAWAATMDFLTEVNR